MSICRKHIHSPHFYTKCKPNYFPVCWLLPPLFFIGYLATYSKLEEFAIQYLGLTFFSIIACCLLLTRLTPPLHKKLPIWIIFAVFILAHYFKFYLMVHNPEILGDGWVMRKLYFLLQSPTVLLKSVATISYAFITFCLTGWFLLGDSKSLKMDRFKGRIHYKAVILVLLWLIPILMGITTYIIYITGICRMAADNNPYLPFRLAGWIFYIRMILIPALLLLLIWCSDKAGLRKYIGTGIILMLLHGISDMLLRSSRGVLLGLFIMLIILFLVTERITKKHVLLFGIILLTTIMLWPVISSYRYIRVAGGSIPIGTSFLEALDNIWSSASFAFFNILKETGISIIYRFTGADSLVHIMDAGFQPLYVDTFGGSMSVAKFFTVDVIGFPAGATHCSAPSSLGLFYLVGGNGLVVIGTFGFILLTWFCWRLLTKLKLRCLPVAQALFLWWIFGHFTGGVLNRLYLEILVLVGSIAVCEYLARLAGSAVVFKNVRDDRGLQRYASGAAGLDSQMKWCSKT